jgi:hypothetical protein
VARSQPRSSREADAKASAIRTLERLSRGKRKVPPMPEGWYPHGPGDPLYELDWVLAEARPLGCRASRQAIARAAMRTLPALDRCHKGLWGTPLGTWSSGRDVDVSGQAAFCLLIHADRLAECGAHGKLPEGNRSWQQQT